MWRACKIGILSLLAVTTGFLALLSVPVLANSLTESLPVYGDAWWWTSAYGCGNDGTPVQVTGVGQNTDGAGPVVQQFGAGPPTLPAGAYWVGQTVSGTITNGNPGYPGTSHVGVDYTFGCINAPYGGGYGYAAGMLGGQLSLGAGASSVDYSGELEAPWDSAVQSVQAPGWNFPGIVVGGAQDYGYSTSNNSTTMDYAFIPSNIGVQEVYSGNGTQVTVSWNPDGNDSGTTYTLQRETLDAGGAAVGWTTIYQGTATGFQTSDQSCGHGYGYRVQANGPQASTPWDASAEWDEHPCGESVAGAAATAVTVSWPLVTANAVPAIVWCEEGTPAGGVSCRQKRFDIGAGATSATLTGLVANAEYAVWACTATDGWGCPEVNVWTHAAVPTLNLDNNPSGLGYDQQPVTWTATGNAPGTVYRLRQGSFTPSGGGSYSWIYTGTGSSAVGGQNAGGSYAYWVFAENFGYGNARTSPSNGLATQVASTPVLTTTGTTTATISWSAVAAVQTTGVACTVANSTWHWFYPGPATGGATSLQVTGLQANTQYYCATYAIASNQGIQWWQGAPAAYTAAEPPIPGSLRAAQASVWASWGGNGNPGGTTFQYSVVPAGSGPVGGGRDMTTATAVTVSTDSLNQAIVCGTAYTVEVQAMSGSGVWTGWVGDGTVTTVPCAPTITGGDGGLGWAPTSGRGYVTLSWSAVPGATGYTLYVWDGATYEAFDLGESTQWDSRHALIYPPDTALYPNVTEASKSAPMFSHNAGGRNLRDRPLDLYCTTGTNYCTTSPAQNYWFTIAAYNAAGSSARFQVPGSSAPASSYYEPTLPLQTDPAAPTITNWSLNGGAAYTYSSTVSFSLAAAEGTSGIAAYALSNDGSTWQTTALSGCAVDQVAPCRTSLSTGGVWTLLPGPGSKTVWGKVESAAGVWSSPMATTVYVNVDQTVPTVDVTLDGGAGATSGTAVTVAVDVSDPAAQNTPLTWQVRYSSNGGETWSAWQSEGTAMHWSSRWTIPGGASGERTVLAQVENNDDNLGQGGATVYYAAPGGGGGAGLPAGSGGQGHACVWPVDGTDVAATCVISSQVAVPLSPPSGAVQMRLSLDDATWGPWQAAATGVAVDLGASPGAKTVWVEYRDGAGTVVAESPIYYVYDPAGPSVDAAWAGDASATDGAGQATLDVQAADDVGPVAMTVTVTENGAQLYSGAYRNSLPLTLTGSGYQMVQVTVSDAGGNQTSTQLGIYVL